MAKNKIITKKSEAFLEAYHVLETHSEGVYTAGDANADYDIFGDHISRFVHTIGYTSPHITENRPSEQEILDMLMDYLLQTQH